MPGWRDIRAGMKKRVHATFSMPAVYLASLSSEPMGLSARVRKRVVPMAMPGTEMPSIAQEQVVLVFSVAEITRVRKDGYVIFAADEIYQIGSSEPPVAGYFEVAVIQLPPARAAEVTDAIAEPDADVWDGILF